MEGGVEDWADEKQWLLVVRTIATKRRKCLLSDGLHESLQRGSDSHHEWGV